MLNRVKTLLRDLLRTLPFAAWGALKLFPLSKHKAPVMNSIEGPVLVFATNAIGDTVTQLPALQAIMNQQRPAKIDVLVRPKTAALFSFFPGVGDVVTLERLTFPFTLRTLRANVATIRELRRRRYATALIFTSNFWTAWVGFLIGAQERYGFSRSERVGLANVSDFGFLLTHDKGEFRNRNYLKKHNEFSEWILPGSTESSTLPILHTKRAGPKPKLIRRAAGKNRVVVLNPVASQPIKDWPLERWAELADALTRNSIQVVACCEPGQSHRLKGLFNPDVLIHDGLSLSELIELLADADAIATNDSGPLHLGYALGKPTLAIFGPTDEAEVIPPATEVTVIRKQIECAPCYHLGTYDKCPLTHHRCLKEITVDEVLTAVLLELQKERSPMAIGA